MFFRFYCFVHILFHLDFRQCFNGDMDDYTHLIDQDFETHRG